MRPKNIYKFFLLCVCKAAFASLNVAVDAPSAILMNAQTGVILYQKNAHTPLPPASITKIATALYALEKTGSHLNDSVHITDAMMKYATQTLKKQHPDRYLAHFLERDGTHIHLQIGEDVQLQTLLEGMMLCSGNDAANAVASHLCGSVESFNEELDRFLKQKGITHTRFKNPHGLHHDEHVTTACDMALITKEALKNSRFCEIVSATKLPRPSTNKNPESFFVQSNRLLKPGPYYYSKAIGIKTGYTSKAGFNLVAAAKDHDRTLIAVLMNEENSESRYRDAIHLFEAAFNETQINRILFAKQKDVFRLNLPSAIGPIEGVIGEDLVLTYFPSEEPSIKASIAWVSLQPPIQKDQIVGEIQIKNTAGDILLRSPIYALHEVDITFSAKCSYWVKEKKVQIWQHRTFIVLSLSLIILLLSIFLKVRKRPGTV